MTKKRDQVIKHVLTVEGETERWYLEWLQDRINESPTRKHEASIEAKVYKHPSKFTKTVSPTAVPLLYHLCDIEGSSDECIKEFHITLSELKEAKAEGFKCELGYSCLTFELWMILHKKECNRALEYKHQYLNEINKAYDENFECLNDYKEEANFKRCLSKLSLDDVRTAITRAKKIMHTRAEESRSAQYKGYTYYVDNPSLTIGNVIEKILKQHNLL